MRPSTRSALAPTRSRFRPVTVDDVSRHFGRRRAVSRVSFVAARGAIVGLLGPNGAGKSTLLAMLATLLRPSAGTIRYGTHRRGGRAAALRARIGVLGHDLFLYPELTARENLAFFAGLYGRRDADAAAARGARAGRPRRPRRRSRLELLARHAAARRARARADSRAAPGPARRAVHRPRRASASALVARLRGLRESGAIVVLATHDLDLAEGLLDEAVFLRDGRMVEARVAPRGLRSTLPAASMTRIARRS